MFPQLPSSVGNRHEKWYTESGTSRLKKNHTHRFGNGDTTILPLHQGASGKKIFSLRSAWTTEANLELKERERKGSMHKREETEKRRRGRGSTPLPQFAIPILMHLASIHFMARTFYY